MFHLRNIRTGFLKGNLGEWFKGQGLLCWVLITSHQMRQNQPNAKLEMKCFNNFPLQMSTKMIFCWICISLRENCSAGEKWIGQLWQQRESWEVKFIPSGLMGCENLASLSTWRPFLVLLRGFGGEEWSSIAVSPVYTAGMCCSRQGQGWKPHGVAFYISNSHPDNQAVGKSWSPSHISLANAAERELATRATHPTSPESAPALLPLLSKMTLCVYFFTSVEAAGLCPSPAGTAQRTQLGDGWLGWAGRSTVCPDSGEELSWIERTKPGWHMDTQNRPSSNISCKLQQCGARREQSGCSKRTQLLCGMWWLWI